MLGVFKVKNVLLEVEFDLLPTWILRVYFYFYYIPYLPHQPPKPLPFPWSFSCQLITIPSFCLFGTKISVCRHWFFFFFNFKITSNPSANPFGSTFKIYSEYISDHCSSLHVTGCVLLEADSETEVSGQEGYPGMLLGSTTEEERKWVWAGEKVGLWFGHNKGQRCLHKELWAGTALGNCLEQRWVPRSL